MQSSTADLTFSYLEGESNGKVGLSLEQFSRIVQSHLTCIAKAQHSLQSALIPLTIENSDVQPDQFKKAINSLNEMNVPIRKFCNLFHDTQRLPIIITALRYQLLLTLHRIEEQIGKLADLIDGYRLICITPSRLTLPQRKEIYSSFVMLLQYLTDISQEAKLLNDEAKFQERKINAKLEEQPSTKNVSTGNPDSHKRLFIVKKNENGIDVS